MSCTVGAISAYCTDLADLGVRRVGREVSLMREHALGLSLDVIAG
jgi:hypothetical protein